MQKTSIFYYTNNLVSPKLLRATLSSAVEHCHNNNCELILTSHYPLSEKYEVCSLGEDKASDSSIYNYIVKEPIIKEDDNVKCYVVGKLSYCYSSIMKQILFSLDKCSGDNIILMEHDCFYPENYIKTVENCLIGYGKNMTYCNYAIVFLNENGFFNMDCGSFVLSTCAAKKEIFKGIYEKKLELYQNKKPCTFEPLLDIAPVSKKNAFKNEMVVKNHVCIDAFLKNPVMDIKHHLNTDGYYKGKEYYHCHSYWGEDKKYIDLINMDIKEENKKLWNYGIGKYDF